jgi:hypothetical protein
VHWLNGALLVSLDPFVTLEKKGEGRRMYGLAARKIVLCLGQVTSLSVGYVCALSFLVHLNMCSKPRRIEAWILLSSRSRGWAGRRIGGSQRRDQVYAKATAPRHQGHAVVASGTSPVKKVQLTQPLAVMRMIFFVILYLKNCHF